MTNLIEQTMIEHINDLDPVEGSSIVGEHRREAREFYSQLIEVQSDGTAAVSKDQILELIETMTVDIAVPMLFIGLFEHLHKPYEVFSNMLRSQVELNDAWKSPLFQLIRDRWSGRTLH